MALYGYQKLNPNPRQRFRRRFLAGGFLGLGILLLLWAIFPLIRYQFYYGAQFVPVVSPLISGEESLSDKVPKDSLVRLENWFSRDSNLNTNSANEGTSYFLTIPKLKIYQANVIVGARSLDKSLVQYPGTALPGQPGNTVILGHSVLPQFFNPDNYLTIFSPLYNLHAGDKILLDYGNKRYTYAVNNLYEVSPRDLQPLRQDFSQKKLTLITCSPPGTSLRRLIVEAKLQ